MTAQQPADIRQEALAAFLRNLPRLWQERPGQWVAYHGSELLGFAGHKHLLYQQCLERGLDRESFVVFCIEPQETEITLGPVVID